jgi:hypothetical protein
VNDSSSCIQPLGNPRTQRRSSLKIEEPLTHYLVHRRSQQFADLRAILCPPGLISTVYCVPCCLYSDYIDPQYQAHSSHISHAELLAPKPDSRSSD